MRARHARGGVVPAGGKNKKRGEVEVLRGLGDRPMVTRCETCRFRDRGPGGGIGEREPWHGVTALRSGRGFQCGVGARAADLRSAQEYRRRGGGRRYRVPRKLFHGIIKESGTEEC